MVGDRFGAGEQYLDRHGSASPQGTSTVGGVRASTAGSGSPKNTGRTRGPLPWSRLARVLTSSSSTAAAPATSTRLGPATFSGEGSGPFSRRRSSCERSVISSPKISSSGSRPPKRSTTANGSRLPCVGRAATLVPTTGGGISIFRLPLRAHGRGEAGGGESIPRRHQESPLRARQGGELQAPPYTSASRTDALRFHASIR